jgi:hypothetical protein
MRRLPRMRDERGFAMVIVVGLITVLGVISITLIDMAQSESKRSRSAVVRDASYQAAEAGLNDYFAKLFADSLYYSHFVHPGESTRRGADGTLGAKGTTWSGGLGWTYPNGKDGWRQLSNGYEYNLQITPPTSAKGSVHMVATGRPGASADTSDWRVIETLIRPASVADFQMLANADISYGSGASTYGKIYAGIDSNGVRHNVNHSGYAYADIYAEGSVTGSPRLRNGAQTYDRNTIRTVIKNPINFNDFITSLVDIQAASQAGGVYLNDATAAGWRLTFQSNGTVSVQRCTRTGSADIAQTAPTCGASTSYAVPVNGAIYSPQSVVVSGQVNGRVTVGSNANVVIADNISYAQSGDDVLGLVAANDMLVAQYVPYDLNWRAGTIAQTGSWRSWSNDGSHGTMTFTGSTATADGGSMSLFRTRVYQYDDTLYYLPPPWFPTVEDAYTTLLVRELPAG